MFDFDLNDCKRETIEIVNYIKEFCGDDRNPFFENKPKIKLSDEIKTKTYKGKYKDSQVIDIIDNIVIKNKQAKDYIEKIKKELLLPVSERHSWFYREIICNLKRMINGEMECEKLSPFDKEKIKRIIDAYENRDHTDIILGEYNHKSRTIILYRQAIINNTLKNSDVIENMKRVLIHEMFHAYHHYYLDGLKTKGTVFARSGYGRSVARESLARFVEYAYCKDVLGEKYCNEIEDSWDERFFEYYPYSGAKYLTYGLKCEDLKREEVKRFNRLLINKLLSDGKQDLIDTYHDIVYLYKYKEFFPQKKIYTFEDLFGDTYYNNEKEEDILEYIKTYEIEESDNYHLNIFNFMTMEQVEDRLSENQSFADILEEMIKAKEITDPECYKASHVNKEAFNKIINGTTKTPTRETVCSLAIGLKLNTDEYERFLKAAGYARNNDVNNPINIVGVYIDEEDYDDYNNIYENTYKKTGKKLTNYDGRKE